MPELLNKVLFSLISGFSEFIFVSVPAHQLLYTTVTGTDQTDSVLFLAIHIGCLAALLLCCGKRLKRLRYERRLATSVRRRKTRHPDPAALMDMRIVNTAVVPVLLSLLISQYASRWITSPVWIALLLVVNGMILFLPSLLSSGNKDGRSFTMLDGLLMGLGGILGTLPGISRLGCMFSVGLLRGAEKSYSLDLSLLISIPVTVGLLCFDVYAVAMAGFSPTGYQMLGYILSALASFLGAYLSVLLVRYICNRANAAGFAYYSCGLAVFLFLLYLIIP